MSPPRGLAAAIRTALGRGVTSMERCPGGDICDAWRVGVDGGLTVFAKTHAHAPRSFFETEARWLVWLREAQTVDVPAVLAVLDRPVPALVLEWIEPSAPTPDTDERLGYGLAALHRSGADGWGAPVDGHLGPLKLPNAATASWAEMWGERRLRPLVRLVVERGTLATDTIGRVDALAARLPDLVAPDEPPSRLHGDLWAGNVVVGNGGRPWLVDPFSFGGHREVDVAMMRLFGGFSARVFAAYDEAWPLPAGHQERVDLYQLFPLLVHCFLFGEAYAAQTLAALDRVERRSGS